LSIFAGDSILDRLPSPEKYSEPSESAESGSNSESEAASVEKGLVTLVFCVVRDVEALAVVSFRPLPVAFDFLGLGFGFGFCVAWRAEEVEPAKEIAVGARAGEASRAGSIVAEGAAVETTREETRGEVRGVTEVICAVGFDR
jgi:hypothetical protein